MLSDNSVAGRKLEKVWFWYIDFEICICYNASRQNDTNSHAGSRKAPEVGSPGLFYSVVVRWLTP